MDNEKFQELVLEQLKALTEGQQELRQEVTTIQQGQARIEGRVTAIEEGQTRLESRLTAVEEGQRALQKDVTRIETRIENEAIEKISALFDGFNLRGNQIDNLQKHFDERLDNIAHDVNFLIGKTARQETAIQELKRAK